MSGQRIMYVGQAVADELSDRVEENLDRYTKDGFDDMVAGGNWSIPLRVEYDPAPLAELDPETGPEAEIANSQRVWSALHSLTPSLARENRIWVRISHLDCLEYCRNRWLTTEDESDLASAVRTHMFAPTLTGARDDHAISRLWWNSWIAHQTLPQDPDVALKLMLSRSDVRLSLVERPWIFSRVPLAAGIFRLFLRSDWPLAAEAHYREVMKVINVLGTGVVFEAMASSDIDAFLDKVQISAQATVNVASRQGGQRATVRRKPEVMT